MMKNNNRFEFDKHLPYVIPDTSGAIIARFAEEHLALEYAETFDREVIDTYLSYGVGN